MKHLRTFVSALSVLMLVATLAALTQEVPSSSVAGATTQAPTVTDPVTPVAATWRPPVGGSMNIPRSSQANELRNERRVIAALNHAWSGSEVRMVMFSWDRWPVTDAVLRARKRNVSVKIIINDHELTPAARRLKQRLGTNRARKNFFFQCKSACRGVGDVQHSKFILISQSGKARNVVMLGSLNMKRNGTHNQFNDLLTLNNRPRVYDELKRVFWQMKYDRAIKDSYIRKDFGPNMRLWVMPFPKGRLATDATRWTNYRDPMSQILRDVKCRGAATKSGRTIIRVSMHAWDKERGLMIARQFRKLWDEGCDVKIDVGFAGRQIRKLFAQPTKRGYMRVRSSAFDTNYDGEIDKYSHLKLLLIDGNYDGKRNNKVVVTGSSNYQNGGQYGDEIFFRLYWPFVYNQYIKNWNRLYHHYTHGFVRMGNNYRLAGGPILTNGVNDKMPDWRDE